MLEQDVDPVLAIEGEELLAELGRPELVEEAVAHVDQGHREAELAEGGGDLHADEASADDDRTLGACCRPADPVRVVERAQRVDAFEVGARDS